MIKKKIKKLPPNYMDAVMSHNPAFKWSENDGIVVVDVINSGIYHRIAQKLFHKPGTSHIRLDKYGSRLWKAIDGRNTVFDIFNIMVNAFPDEKNNMLNRMVAFMQILQNNKFIYCIRKN